jgi:hypothetical protein
MTARRVRGTGQNENVDLGGAIFELNALCS